MKLLARIFGRKPHIDLREGETGVWHLRIVAPNGERMGATETFASRSNAVRAANTWRSYTGWEIRSA